MFRRGENLPRMSPDFKRILVADDEKDICVLLDDFLTGKGFSVRCVCDGAEALKALAEEPFAVVIVDLAMPKVGGIDVVARASKEYPKTSFVVITGYPSDHAVVDAMNAGAMRFLPKPFKLDDVLTAVKDGLQLGRAPEPAGKAPIAVEARPDWVDITAPSRKESRDRLEHLFELLSGQNLPPDEMRDIRIALGEVVSNAIEWGNKHDLTKPVRVSYCLFPHEIVFKIEDLGVGFEPEEVPDPLETPEAPLQVAQDRESSGKRPGGFGVAIARNVMDQIIYNRVGNSVVMSKRFSRS